MKDIRKFHGIAIIAAGTLALAACGPKASTTTETNTTSMNAATDTTTNSVQAAPALSSGQTFANAAAASDSFEIATSTLAVVTSKSAAVRKFATDMIEAHTESTGKLKAAAASAIPALTPDATPSAEQQSTLDALKTKTGMDFDAAYIAAQIDAHEKTLAKLKDYAATGDVAPLKTFAAALVPAVTAHLNMAKGLKH